uniref:Uncharacterized protein n=2 Tax=Parascaris univalens TaxID=6257 RepID=A0A915CKI1_PARUN
MSYKLYLLRRTMILGNVTMPEFIRLVGLSVRYGLHWSCNGSWKRMHRAGAVASHYNISAFKYRNFNAFIPMASRTSRTSSISRTSRTSSISRTSRTSKTSNISRTSRISKTSKASKTMRTSQKLPPYGTPLKRPFLLSMDERL